MTKPNKLKRYRSASRKAWRVRKRMQKARLQVNYQRQLPNPFMNLQQRP